MYTNSCKCTIKFKCKEPKHISILSTPPTLSPLNQEWIGDQAAINLIKLP